MWGSLLQQGFSRQAVIFFPGQERVLHSIVMDQQGKQHSVRPPAIIVPGLGKHLSSPVYALRTKGVGTTYAANSYYDDLG